MSFVVYDLVFLAAFALFVIVFLSTRKKNLKREGPMYLYKTKLGLTFMQKFADGGRGILKPLRYVVVACGYVLMVSAVWIFIKTAYMYVTSPIAELANIPPVAPIIPYFPEIFGVESFFPPLYFTYFIIVLSVVAISHEAAHGIFARLENIKIHTTGFAFLGPFLGAFVEQDEEDMKKAKKFSQLSVLAAGTFANILMTLIFGGIMFLFFTAVFVPSGVKFVNYQGSVVGLDAVNVVGPSEINERFLELELDGITYYATQASLDYARENSLTEVFVYDDAPAFRAQLVGAITEIDGSEITGRDSLTKVLSEHSPGDSVVVKSLVSIDGREAHVEEEEFEVTLGDNAGRAYLGISIVPDDVGEGVSGFIQEKVLSKMKSPSVYYSSEWGDFGWFVYYLLWWMFLINLLVAFFNMLPISILDGGRFFALTVWGITGKESFGNKAFKLTTWFFLALLALMMVWWVFGLF